MKFSIAKNLSWAFALIIGMLLLIGVYSVSQFKRMNMISEESITLQEKTIRLSGIGEKSRSIIRLNEFVLNGADYMLDAFLVECQILKENLYLIDKHKLAPDEIKLLAELRTSLTALTWTTQDHVSSQDPKVTKMSLKKSQLHARTFSRITEDLALKLKMEMMDNLRASREGLATSTSNMMLFVGLAVLMSMVIAVYFVLYISRPVQKLTGHIRMAARGDYKTINSNMYGEVGKLTKYFNIMIRKIERSQTQLTEKNNELNTFIYKATHDIRGPLCSIMGISKTATANVKDPKALEHFELINTCVSQLDDIIIGLTNITHIKEASKPKDEMIDLEKELPNILESMKKMPQYQGFLVRSDIDCENGFYSDRYLIISILQNLITNSIQYSDPNKTQPSVSITIVDTSRDFIIRVEDNGLGIPSNYHSKVFEMFYRANDSSMGSGLGLYIVKNAVDNLKGTIKLESTVREGTKITIRFPKSSTFTPPRQIPELLSKAS